MPIGTCPVTDLAPEDYRYALDAAAAVLAAARAPLVLCNAPHLAEEARGRLVPWDGRGEVDGALWVEPLVETWLADLKALALRLPPGAPLVVVASRPLAYLWPGRRQCGHPLCRRPWGVGLIERALSRAGFAVASTHGVRTGLAIGLALLGEQAERRGYPRLGDRLQAAARLRFCAAGPLAALSTVALLIGRREGYR